MYVCSSRFAIPIMLLIVNDIDHKISSVIQMQSSHDMVDVTSVDAVDNVFGYNFPM